MSTATDASSQKKISFFATSDTECPVCKAGHRKEELFSGGGRLVAGKLTPELRRTYLENKKFGVIYPLAYVMQVCPVCLYAAYPKDFNRLNIDEIQAIKGSTDHRRKLMTTVFTKVDFKENRNLVHGAASMILAVDCYHLRLPNIAPTPKKAVSSIRAAWLFDDLFQLANYRPYDKVRDFYYMEAVRNYMKTLDLMQSGKEPLEQESYVLGPDLDHNWGFDGIIYLNAYLTKKYYTQLAEGREEHYKILDYAKRYLSKLYGMGRSSKSKPSIIIDMSKELYDEINALLTELAPKT
ncbi:MAG: DUF2225 domain-containing protein [Spirochaetia bacterium]|nr:DUF2225 domain-containing protein [Spirochaetia bacterium]